MEAILGYFAGVAVAFLIVAFVIVPQDNQNAKDQYQKGYQAQYTYLLKHGELKATPIPCIEVRQNTYCIK